MDLTQGVWLLPSRRRIHNLERFFEGARFTGMASPGMVLVQEDEYRELKAQYDALDMPRGWTIWPTKGDTQGDKVREVFAVVSEGEWVGLLGDDCVPATPDWDKTMIAGLQGWNLVSCNDGWQAPMRVANCWVWSGALLRAVGYAFPADLNHLYIDDIWENIGRATSSWNCRMDVVVKHVHATVSKTEDDTHRRAYSDENWAHDTQVYQRWHTEQFQRAIDAVEQLKIDLGIEAREVEMKDVKVMICTPSGQAKFCTDYVMSLLQTFTLFQQRNIAYKWVVEGGNSDVVAARNELLSVFYHSDFTHILFIDDDMGWDPQAISRLFYAKQDFVAVAGRKKRDAEIYALNLFRAEGRMVPVAVDRESWTVEVKAVGMAFCLMTRRCVEQMVQAYPELRYQVPGEHDRFALFMPVMEDGVYNAEDYAYCARWRAIGGKVRVCADVPLKHIGGHQCYEGAWTNVWVKEPVTKELQDAAE